LTKGATLGEHTRNRGKCFDGPHSTALSRGLSASLAQGAVNGFGNLAGVLPQWQHGQA
jgi:hypothetical protein